MADEAAPASLGDFFANKKKKKTFKAVNLNNAGSEKPAAKKETKKGDDEWEEEEKEENVIQVPQMKLAKELGKLEKEKEVGEAEEAGVDAPAWGKVQKGSDDPMDKGSRKFPTLAAANKKDSISIEEQDERQNQKRMNKNAFAGLAGGEEEDDDEEVAKKPKEPLRPAKKKGEFEASAGGAVAEQPSKAASSAPAKKKEEKKEEKKKEEKKDEKAEETSPDLLIKPDEEAIRNKFIGRKKLPKKPMTPRGDNE